MSYEQSAAFDPKCAAQHLGPWVIEPAWFRSAVEAVKSGTWKPQIHAASERTEKSKFRPYNIDRDGIVAINIVGPMMKGWSKYGGTSTVWARRVIRQAADDSDVKGIILLIDSPGGTVAGTADLADDVRAAAQTGKPVIAYGQDLMASAAYWVASQADQVVASPTTEVGSIGTVAVVEDLSGRAAMMGIKVHVIATGRLKGSFVDGTEVTEEQLTYLQGRVEDLNDFFLEAVADGRGRDRETVEGWATGEVWIARKALELGLIDRVENLETTVEDLRRQIKPRKRSYTIDITKAKIELAKDSLKNI